MLNSVCALRVILDKLEPVPQKFKQINSTTTALRSEITKLKQALKTKQYAVTPAIVDNLVTDIRDFNAGAVDTALDRHIDKVLSAWLTKNKLKE